jgi:outer membrane protein assembly factor BamB
MNGSDLESVAWRVVVAVSSAIGGSAVDCPSWAENWPNWRGNCANGVAANDGFPVHWDTHTNIAWSVPLPGPGSSTPVTWGDRIFVTCENQGQNALVCLSDRGETQWVRNVGSYREAKHRKATGANPSAVTDGHHVAAYFKSGDLACFDLDGKLNWKTNLQQRFGADTLWWDLGTSPVLVQDFVIVACLQTGGSYLAAFDARTGEVAWKVNRNLPAPDEANHSYTTPILAEADRQTQLVVLGADHITGHAVRDGREIWRLGGLNPEQAGNVRLISSPVCDQHHVYACYARGERLLAARIDGKGDVTATHLVWSQAGNFSDVPTPTLDDQHLYVCADRGDVYCIGKQDGHIVWKQTLPRSRAGYSASPIRAGSRLYVTSEEGTTVVLDLTAAGKVLAENRLEAPCVATPVLVNHKVLIRTLDRLWCVSGEGEADTRSDYSTRRSQ